MDKEQIIEHIKRMVKVYADMYEDYANKGNYEYSNENLAKCMALQNILRYAEEKMTKLLLGDVIYYK